MGQFFVNKQNNTWLLGNMKFISCVDISRSLRSLVRYPRNKYIRNKFHISAHQCIILYLYFIFLNNWLVVAFETKQH